MLLNRLMDIAQFSALVWVSIHFALHAGKNWNSWQRRAKNQAKTILARAKAAAPRPAQAKA